MTATPYFRPGTLVSARGREWLVLPGSPPGAVLARPLAGQQEETTALLPELEAVVPATFQAPSVDDRGDAAKARLLRDALRLSFRATAGPFRSFGSLAVAPRNYQLVPLMMSAAQETTRLLIADGVGVGKTVEAGLIVAELLATGEAERLAVLCSPQLAAQWQSELRSKFGISAELLLPSTAARLSRGLPFGATVYEHYPYLIVSTDYIKQRSRRAEFSVHCPDLVVVDEAHTSIAPSSITGTSAHMRYTLLRRLADDPARHLLLLTATPHNGDDGAWQSLIGLLDNRLAALPTDLSGPERDSDRQLLAKYLIQRQRADIREYLDEDTPFANRLYAEESYRLTDEYRRLLDRVLAYARETVLDPNLNALRQRVRWWSAIALLRCLASSPASAEQTLLKRSDLSVVGTTQEADELAGPRVFDADVEDSTDGEDVALGIDIDAATAETADEANRRKLRQFAADAAALKGPKSDAKLKRAISMVKKLVDDGYHPILFCRYIPTAEYVAEHLAEALRHSAVRVDAVTGTLPPEEREDRVRELTAHPGPRVLVATDCLSEGVNLQEGFTAVIHYDLAWNPTRHEQREGRVDRFGQTAKDVKAVTYYGSDNRIDGVVLDVLIRRHVAIKKSTGVSVPVPVDAATVMNAVWESLLLRGTEPDQLTLDLGAHMPSSASDAVLTQWQDAAEREKASRSRFRQAALKPEDVAPTLDEMRRALGGPTDAEVFTRNALMLVGGQITDTDDGFVALLDTAPRPLRDQLPTPAARLRLRRNLPAPRGDALLSRTDESVEAIARYTLDAALDPLVPADARPARRAAAIRTSAVSEVTILLVVRYRFELVLPGRGQPVTQVAEDARFLAFTTADDGQAVWLDQDATDALLDAPATATVNDDLARAQLQEAIDHLPVVQARLLQLGQEIARETEESHRRVRQASGVTRRGLTAKALPPADVLGLYVYLPGPGRP